MARNFYCNHLVHRIGVVIGWCQINGSFGKDVKAVCMTDCGIALVQNQTTLTRQLGSENASRHKLGLHYESRNC